MAQKTEKPAQTVESLQMAAKIIHYRYALVLTFVFTAVAFTIAGYFLSINVTDDARSQVVNTIVLKAEK